MIAARFAIPRPSQRPIAVKISTAAGSPSRAATVTSVPVSAAGWPPASSSSRRADTGDTSASSRASRASAVPLAYISQQPRLPQAHRRPSGTTAMCPHSQATPKAPR